MRGDLALVTGATGFIGRHLVEELVRRRWPIRVLARDPARARAVFGHSPELNVVAGDVRDPDSLSSALRGTRFVFHLAGVTKALQPRHYFEINQHGTRNLCEAVRRSGADLDRLVHVSSLAAAGPADTPTPPEEFPTPHPVSRYGYSKLLGEREAQRLADTHPVTLFRPPAVFGAHDTDVLVFFRGVARGWQPVVGGDRHRVSLVYAPDLAVALADAALAPATVGRTYYPCYPTPFSWAELGDSAAALLGKRCRRVTVPRPLVWALAALSEFGARLSGRVVKLDTQTARELMQPYWVCSSAAATRDFGFAPRFGLPAAFAETIDWYRQHGQL